MIIKELSQISLIERGVDSKTAILSGYNVTSVSVKDGVVYYTAEDNQENPVIGKYDTAASTNTTLDSGKKYIKITTLPQ
ncbi:MAG: hypothetical protein ACOH5I_19975 [Oligoflexus sp.]